MKNEWLEKSLLCFIDFETTGLDVERDFPIEVALIMTDYKCTKILMNYSSLVFTSALGQYYSQRRKDSTRVTWLPEHMSAYDIHHINLETLQATGICAHNACIQICTEVNKVKLDLGSEKVILISDNIHFDMSFMKQMWKESPVRFPFHYCGWDTNLLLEHTFGDITKRPHNAAADCRMLFNRTKKAMSFLRRSWVKYAMLELVKNERKQNADTKSIRKRKANRRNKDT